MKSQLAVKATYADPAEAHYSIQIPEVPKWALCAHCRVFAQSHDLEKFASGSAMKALQEFCDLFEKSMER